MESSLGRLACEPMTVRGCAFHGWDTTADGLVLGAGVDRRVRMVLRRYGRGLALRGTSSTKVKYSRRPVASNAQLAVWE